MKTRKETSTIGECLTIDICQCQWLGKPEGTAVPLENDVHYVLSM